MNLTNHEVAAVRKLLQTTSSATWGQMSQTEMVDWLYDGVYGAGLSMVDSQALSYKCVQLGIGTFCNAQD